jgi:hypothetical protein
MGCLAQTVHLSCCDTNIISKQVKTWFHMTHHLAVPSGASETIFEPMVRQKWFISLWYVWRKPCTYLAPALTLSPYRLKWASTWASSSMSTIKCVQNGLWANGICWCKSCTYLTPTLTCLQTDQNELPLEPHHLGVTSVVSKTISKPMVRSAQTVHLNGPILA